MSATPASPEHQQRARPIPGPHGTGKLRGLLGMLNDIAPTLDELTAAYGPISQVGVPGLRVVVLGDPALINEMASMKADAFRWRHKFNAVGVRFVVGRRSMIVSDGDDHHRRRGSVQRAFTRRRLNNWIPMIVDRTDSAIDDVIARVAEHGSDSTIDLYPVAQELIIGVTLHAFFGERMADRADEFGRLFQRSQAFIEAPGVHQIPHPIPFTKRSKVRADRRQLDRIINEEVADRRARPAGDPFDILEVIANDDTLSDAEIRDQVVSLIGAGFDTTASAFAWMLWCAALEPGVWARLRAEADSVLGPPDSTRPPPDDSTLSKLDVAQSVVHESLRLHPAGLIGVRLAARDLPIGGHTVKKGTLIAWSPYLAGRDPHTWSDPLAFDPDRYASLTEDQQGASDRAWIPFGRGPHMCLGFALAQMELVLMIARVAQRLDLTPTAERAPHPKGTVVSRPEGGAPFIVRQRG